MSIPLVDLVAQYDSLKDELDAAMVDALQGMQLFLGKNVRAFESEFAAYCGARECIGVSDGTAALHIALRALGVGPGDEVIVPAHTFFATAEATALAGATPVFADAEPETRCVTAATIAAKITERTKAIIVVHIHGQIAEMAPIVALARERGIPLIEDAAQAHGAEYNGRRAGSLADVACFSFYFSKNLGAYGEAGGITTDDAALAERIRTVRDHGSRVRYQHEVIGMNGRLDEVQAAVLRVKLPHLDRWNARRRELAARYDDLLAETPVELPVAVTPERHVWHHYAVLAPRRDELQEHLKALGIGTGIHYPIPCHLQPAVLDLYGEQPAMPVAERIGTHVLSLPIYAEMTEAQVGDVADAVRSFYADAPVPAGFGSARA